MCNTISHITGALCSPCFRSSLIRPVMPACAVCVCRVANSCQRRYNTTAIVTANNGAGGSDCDSNKNGCCTTTAQ